MHKQLTVPKTNANKVETQPKGRGEVVDHSTQGMGLAAMQKKADDHAGRQPLASVLPVQRQIIFGENEIYGEADSLKFLMKYGTSGDEIGKGIQAKQAEISEMLKEGEHRFTDVKDMLAKLGYKPEEEGPKKEKDELTLGVSSVIGKIGDIPGVDAKSVLPLVPSKEKSTHSIYEVEWLEKKYMLKEDRSGLEFQGMQVQLMHGVTLPSVLSLSMSDGVQYLLMDYVKYLGAGLSSFNTIPLESMAQAARDLGKMHVADVRMGNVDRLPWRGNGNKGHLFNVFINRLNYTLLGLDSEMPSPEKRKLREKDIQTELEQINTDPGAYAQAMHERISTVSDKDKLMLDEGVINVFIKGFAEGLVAGLQVK